MEGRIVGVFGTDANAKAALLAPITKKSEAEGAIVVHRRVEVGINYSFLDDAQFPEKVQGYSRIASMADHAVYVLPKFAKMAPPDGELAVIIDSFGLEARYSRSTRSRPRLSAPTSRAPDSKASARAREALCRPSSTSRASGQGRTPPLRAR
ncbi:MAG TPA: hypothetical protein VEO75_00615 [Nitrososphaerales archaeon]|nr:hypothetical protein [Nitrososphaerales archaeon]